ncbi:hypothetical protein D3C80_1256170 [compost metagenome]
MRWVSPSPMILTPCCSTTRPWCSSNRGKAWSCYACRGLPAPAKTRPIWSGCSAPCAGLQRSSMTINRVGWAAMRSPRRRTSTKAGPNGGPRACGASRCMTATVSAWAWCCFCSTPHRRRPCNLCSKGCGAPGRTAGQALPGNVGCCAGGPASASCCWPWRWQWPCCWCRSGKPLWRRPRSSRAKR